MNVFLKSKYAVLFLCGVGLVLILFTRNYKAASYEPDSYEYLIATYGGDNAYIRFADAVKTLTPNQQHDHAHSFGKALFSVLGEEGLSVCDANFGYGCMHEFVGQEIANKGIGYVSSLNEYCLMFEDRSHFCQHGLGHGLVSYFGYTKDDFKNALRVCGDLPHNDPIGGCRGGVFMEYNMQTMLQSYGTTRKVEKDDLVKPCTDHTGDEYMACVYWMPQWLERSAFVDLPSRSAVQKIGEVCARVSPQYQLSCYQGIGNAFAIDETVPKDKRIMLCNALQKDEWIQVCRKTMADR